MVTMKKWFLLIFLTLLLTSSIASAATDKLYVIEIEGMVTAGTALRVENGVKDASRIGASAILIKLDTPGGLVDATMDIVKSIDNSPIQVITYVSPEGAIAASAGTYILLSGDVAVMSSGTTCGACMPVTYDPMGETKPADNKTINFLTAYMKSIAEEKGRPVDIAERFVAENLAITSNEALEKGVVDMIAEDVPELLDQMNMSGAEIYVQEGSLRDDVIDLLSNPQIAFILLLVGIYGIMFGFMSPGTYVPETIGAICLILALYGLGTFEIGVFGIILIIAAVTLFIAEMLTPTYGILTFGGVICLILGALMLPQEPLLSEEWFRTFRLIVIGIAIASAAFFIFGISAVIRTRRTKPTTGSEGLIGLTCEAYSDIDPVGIVKIKGEIWRAESKDRIKKGEKAKIVERRGLTLILGKVNGECD
ncbi:MAG TPA: nodulation protein NfeD [Methanocellales archaeon]|nr:nodulation protein NfeD [Methanocellales archaeon]